MTVQMIEAPVELAPAKKKRYPTRQRPHVPSRSLPSMPGGYAVACFDFAEVIQPHIDRLDRELASREGHFEEEASDEGAIEVITARAALIRGRRHEAAQRRFYGARTCEGRALSAEWADAYLMAVDEQIEELPIPTLPTSVWAAEEMVDIHAENHGETLDELDRKRLGRMLMSFARGYLAAVTDGLPDDDDSFYRDVCTMRLAAWRGQGRPRVWTESRGRAF